MRPIPPTVQARFIAHLKQRTVPTGTYSLYLEWLGYYLDFRAGPPKLENRVGGSYTNKERLVLLWRFSGSCAPVVMDRRCKAGCSLNLS
jgi:hypothetical protein